MNKDNSTAVFNFEAEIDVNGEINFPTEKLKELRKKGFKKVSIVFFRSSEEAVANMNLNLELFNKIRGLQGLPDTVVLDFMVSKGVLSDSKIEERIKL